ncbi:MAG: RNA polymerase sigma factor [Candidatus Delongbacteria bacterium]|nr:RNA polymerase sigma factor [Candidatus Delongbacteria bacterium]
MTESLRNLFDGLVMENQDKVYRLAYGLSGNRSDAEEITQEAFFRAFRFFESFRRESSFFTWIYRITLNVAHDHLQYRRKLPIQALTEDLGYRLDQIVDHSYAGNPEVMLMANEARCKCLHCLTECLPSRQRIVFCLSVTLGLSHAGIAEILECSIGSVKTNLHRAKQRWTGYMSDRCHFIKKDNPCRCEQWVRFGLSQGWVSNSRAIKPRPEIVMQFKDEIVNLGSLRSTYQQLYMDQADQAFVDRLRNGIRNREWMIFSETV